MRVSQNNNIKKYYNMGLHNHIMVFNLKIKRFFTITIAFALCIKNYHFLTQAVFLAFAVITK